jgi:Helix-turn-helix domain
MKKYYKTKPKQILIEHYIRKYEGENMLNIYEAMVVQILASYIGTGKECWEEQSTLSKICRMSIRQLKSILKGLEEKEIIKVRRSKHKNYYSFNEFWISEIEHFSMHCFAADAYLSTKETKKEQSSSACGAPSSACGALDTIYNNKNNNVKSYPQEDQKPKSKDWSGLTKTARKASDLLESYMKEKH